jgi:hypothetical protein
VKNIKKAVAQLKESKEVSDVSDSEQSKGDEEGESHFLCHDRHEFQFAPVVTEFKPQIAKLFQQKYVPRLKLDLRQVVLFDSQSTIDLICNKALATDISKGRGYAIEKQRWYHECEPTGKNERIPQARVVQ